MIGTPRRRASAMKSAACASAPSPASRVELERVDPVGLVPERRHLVVHVGPLVELGDRVVERPVGHPRVHVERARPVRRHRLADREPPHADADERKYQRERAERAPPAGEDPLPEVPQPAGTAIAVLVTLVAVTVVGVAGRAAAAWLRRSRRGPRGSARAACAGSPGPAPGSIGTWLGTTSTTHPAASAERAPVGESSIATHDTGSTPSAAAARRYGSGWGLPLSTMSPVITAWNERGGRCSSTSLGDVLPRHRHQRARHARAR